jgi:hypothetical protein
MLRLPRRIDPIWNTSMVEQNIYKDNTARRLMQGADGRDLQHIARRQQQSEFST